MKGFHDAQGVPALQELELEGQKMNCKYLTKTRQCKIGVELTEGRADPTEEYLHEAIRKSQKMGRCEKDYENCLAYQEWEKRSSREK